MNEIKTEQVWRADLDKAKGEGQVFVMGRNVSDGSRFIEILTLTDEGWLDRDLKPFITLDSNFSLIYWSKIEYPKDIITKYPMEPRWADALPKVYGKKHKKDAQSLAKY